MRKEYDITGSTHYEDMPKELIDMCLECKKGKCSGNCPQYKKKEKQINKSSPFRRRGVAPKKYPFRGGRITIPEMAELVDISPTTIRRHMNSGETMEEIYTKYAR